MHGVDTAARFAAVLDVVVHQKGVVQYFDAGGREQRIVGAATESAGGRNAQCRPQTFTGAAEEVADQSVQIALRLECRHAGGERAVELVTVPGEPFQKVGRPRDISAGDRSIEGKIRRRGAEIAKRRRPGGCAERKIARVDCRCGRNERLDVGKQWR
jgi:hypothetical protein